MSSDIRPQQAPLLSARPLMICVVLGAFSAILIWITKWMTITVTAAIPWLSFPAPLPFWVPILVAPLLLKRQWVALITAVIAAVLSAGAMAVFVALCIEVMVFLRKNRQALSVGWVLLNGVVIGLMTFGFMFLFPEFSQLPMPLILLALAIRLVTNVVYAYLAWIVARALQGVGIGELD